MAVRTRTTQTSIYEGGDARVEEYLDSKGVRYEFIPAANVGDFDAEKSLRNQARFVALDEPRVEAYAEAMKNGDEFPPVIAYGKREAMVVADGNHRLQARITAKKPTMPVYLLAKETPAQTITLIMHEANAKHGKPTSEEERIAAALYLIDNGANARTAAATLSIPQKLVVAASAKRAMDQRFLECGIAPLVVEKLAEAAKRRLTAITTDEGFVAAVDLANRASLTAGEILKMVTDVNTVRSSSKQVAAVKAWAEDYEERISQAGGGAFSKKPRGPKARIGMALGAISGLPDDLEEAAAFYQGAERDEAVKKMRAAARRLNEFARVLSA